MVFFTTKELLREMRPFQWYKNFVIFIPLIFSLNLFCIELWLITVISFFLMCLLSSSIYIINDLKDIEKDRLHPTKKNRPIASGTISIQIAKFTALLFAIFSLSAFFFFDIYLGFLGLFYFAMNLLYSFFLKKYALIDVMVIALGFVVKAITGAIAINVLISPWLIFCVLTMAFILAFGKRRHEFINATNSRDCLSQYNEKMIENFLNISISLFLTSYSLYTYFTHQYLMFTFPFAFYGIFRYLQLVYLNNFGGEAERILKDFPSLLNMTLWILMVVIILYGRSI